MDRPNILLITADDLAAATPATFGGPPGVTPTLDLLAAAGITFGRAHVPIAVFQPSRSAMMTGLMPHRNGAEGFEPIDTTVLPISRLLADAGYHTGILGKVTHLAPIGHFGWQSAVDMPDLGQGRDPGRYAAETRDFLRAAGDSPWLLMINAHDPHRPFHGSAHEQSFFDEDQLEEIPPPSHTFSTEEAGDLPGYLPDLDDVRREYAQYLSSSRRCDDVVRHALAELDAAGQRDHTVIIFLSDNGMAFPYAKANCYLQSTHTPLIVSWPGVTAPGTRIDDTFVTMIDLFPTIAEIAGIEAPETDGISFRALLSGERAARERHRDHVVTVFHETAGKRRYEMRCVQDDQYGYIWNAWYGDVYQAENMAGLSWPAMVEAADHDTELAERVRFYTERTPEELYDLRTDPDGLHNLVGDPVHAEVLAGFRELLADWMTQTLDPLRDRFLTEEPS